MGGGASAAHARERAGSKRWHCVVTCPTFVVPNATLIQSCQKLVGVAPACLKSTSWDQRCTDLVKIGPISFGPSPRLVKHRPRVGRIRHRLGQHLHMFDGNLRDRPIWAPIWSTRIRPGPPPTNCTNSGPFRSRRRNRQEHTLIGNVPPRTEGGTLLHKV